MATTVDSLLDLIRARGFRMTPQRRAIVQEILAAKGHITPTAVTREVQQRIPGVNASTVYRTLEMLEELGVLSHAHLETGPEYHRAAESGHVHLMCSNCGSSDSLSLSELDRLRGLIARHHGFLPDLSHFAISGLCRSCQSMDGGRR